MRRQPAAFLNQHTVRRVTVSLGTLLLCLGFGVQIVLAEESDYVTLTDKTGKFKLEAKILGKTDEKVQLQSKDGRIISVALNKLSQESLELVNAVKSPTKPAAETPTTAQKTIPYAMSALYKAEIQALTEKMQAEGIAVGKPASATVQVSETLAVTGVPASFIKALAARKLIELKALGLVEEGQKADRSIVLKGLAMDWTLPTIVVGGGAEGLTAGKPGALLSIIRTDGSMAATLKAEGVSVAKPNLGRLFWSEIGVAPDHLPLASLLRRFDSALPITEANAAEVAEELVWTKELGIGDGSWEHLADTRRSLQAAILEVLKFEIGDPLDADQVKQKQARDQLEKARTEFNKTWEEGFAKPSQP